MHSLTLADILTSPVTTISAESNVADALTLMHHQRISALVVTHNDYPVGLFTERDAVLFAYKKASPDTVSIKTVMGRPLLTAPANTDYRDGYRLITEQKKRHLVVVDEIGKMCGLVSEANFLNHLDSEFMVQFKRVGSLMTERVLTLPVDAKGEDAIRIMARACVSCVVIEEDGHPVGIFTERDLVSVKSRTRAVAASPISTLMSSPVTTVATTALLPEALQLMVQGKVRRLVVVAGNGNITGLITRNDIVRQLYDNIEHLLVQLSEREVELQSVKHELDLERRNRETERRLKLVLDTLTNCILECDTNGVITYSNKVYHQLLELEEGELPGHYIWDFLETDSDVQRAQAYFKGLLNETQPLEPYLATNVSRTGRKHILKYCSNYRRDHSGNIIGIIAVISDITEYREKELALEVSEIQYRDLFDKMSGGVAILKTINNGQEFRFHDFNKAAEAIAETTFDQLINKTVEEAFPGLKPLGLLDAMYRVWKTGSSEIFPALHYLDKRLDLWFEIRISKLHSGEIFTVFSDVTERVFATEERARLQRELSQSHKMEALGQLTGGIAHDFNNILTIILGMSDLARRRSTKNADEKLVHQLDTVIDAGERARDLVAQMMAFSRKDPLETRNLSLTPMLKDFLKLSRPTMPSSVEFLEEIHPVPDILISPVEIQQVLMNLLINARDAMEEKGEIKIYLGETTLTGSECSTCHRHISGNWVELRISDNGKGITDKNRDHIFEPFFTTKSVGEGTGMGLAVVHGIVERAGGHIAFEKAEPQGAIFRLLFPLADDIGKISGMLIEKTKNHQTPKLAGRVLIVDDEQPIADLAAEILESQGLQSVTFNSSTEALSVFQQNPKDFDAVFTDLTMPKLTGVELIAEIRKLNPYVPVVLMTGYSTAINADQARKIGINHFLEKPFSIDEFVSIARETLSNFPQKAS